MGCAAAPGGRCPSRWPTSPAPELHGRARTASPAASAPAGPVDRGRPGLFSPWPGGCSWHPPSHVHGGPPAARTWPEGDWGAEASWPRSPHAAAAADTEPRPSAPPASAAMPGPETHELSELKILRLQLPPAHPAGTCVSVPECQGLAGSMAGRSVTKGVPEKWCNGQMVAVGPRRPRTAPSRLPQWGQHGACRQSKDFAAPTRSGN